MEKAGGGLGGERTLDQDQFSLLTHLLVALFLVAAVGTARSVVVHGVLVHEARIIGVAVWPR